MKGEFRNLPLKIDFTKPCNRIAIKFLKEPCYQLCACNGDINPNLMSVFC